MALSTIGAGLLVAGGLINALPPVAGELSRVSGGKPIVQILVGLTSAIVGVVLISQLF